MSPPGGVLGGFLPRWEFRGGVLKQPPIQEIVFVCGQPHVACTAWLRVVSCEAVGRPVAPLSEQDTFSITWGRHLPPPHLFKRLRGLHF